MSKHKEMRYVGSGYTRTGGDYERFRSPDGEEVVVYGSFKTMEAAQRAAHRKLEGK